MGIIHRGAPQGRAGLSLVVYAGDCVAAGDIEPPTARLVDVLNGGGPLVLRGTMLESLSDGHQVSAELTDVQLSELFAVDARDRPSDPGRQLHMVGHRLLIELGPYLAVGVFHGFPGARPSVAFARRGQIVPLTEARITYSVAGELRVDDVGTLLVNRDHADRVSEPTGTLPYPFEAK
jgi:hypothetical protein